MAPARMDRIPRGVPQRGIYLLTEGGVDLYVGRSNSMPKRLRNHARPGGTHNQATFAFLLAREQTGLTKATYSPTGSRSELERDPIFRPAFTDAKARVACMHVRCVEETDPVRQALLEMYVALALRTRYNDFDNH